MDYWHCVRLQKNVVGYVAVFQASNSSHIHGQGEGTVRSR